MLDSLNACGICGRPALPIDGWVGEIPGYRLVQAPWQEGFIDGFLHFACLREHAERAEFIRDFTRMATRHDETIETWVDGESHTLSRVGLGYASEVFSGEICRIMKSDVSDSWLVLEKDGPWFGISRRQIEDLAQGRDLRSEGEVMRHILPGDPGPDIGSWGLADLLRFLDVEDRYVNRTEFRDVTYEFFGYHAGKRVLTYSAKGPLPIPPEALLFLTDYASTFTPMRFPDE